MKKAIEIKGIDGHIILYCKSHYNHSGSLLEDLKKIWAIRCGYPYDKNDNSMTINILNRLYKILQPTIINHIHFQEQLHNHLVNWVYKDLSTFENILIFYIGNITNIQIKEKINNKWITLIKLPKPNKRVFNRIIRGNGRYEDYKLIDK